MLEDELLAPGVISAIYVTRGRAGAARRLAARRRRASTTSTTRTSRTTPRRRRRARASSATWTNGSLRQGRAPRLRDRAAARRRAPRRGRRGVADPGDRRVSLQAAATRRSAFPAAASGARQSVHRRLARAVRPRRAGAHRRLLPRRRADRRRGAASTWCAPTAAASRARSARPSCTPMVPKHHPVPRGALAARAGAEGRVRLGARRPGGAAHRQGAVLLAEGQRRFRLESVHEARPTIRGRHRLRLRCAGRSAAHAGAVAARTWRCCAAPVAKAIAADYPDFAKRVWGIN